MKDFLKRINELLTYQAVFAFGTGLMAGSGGYLGFAPFALPSVAASYLMRRGYAHLVGVLAGTLLSGSFASFSSCALFGGVGVLADIARPDLPRNRRTGMVLIMMGVMQVLLLPFMFGVLEGEFYMGLISLLLSPFLLFARVMGDGALGAYLKGRRLKRGDILWLAALLAVYAAGLAITAPVVSCFALGLVMCALVSALRSHSGSVGLLEKAVRSMQNAARVARTMAEYIGSTAPEETLAYSQLSGMSSAFEKLAATRRAVMENKLELVCATAGVPMSGSPCTGDSVAIRRLEDLDLFILSDGMGSGEAAQRESRAAAAMFGDMVALGYDEHAAEQGVNEMMMLSRDEIYSTLDAAAVSPLTGEVLITKFGAPPSFILHQGQVRTIEGASLPCGILSEATGSRQGAVLRRGDALVMMTDGLYEALAHETVASIVECVGGANTPQDAANAMIERGIHRGYEDDMSVIVIRAK